MGAKRTAKKTTSKRSTAPKKAVTPKKAAPGKAAQKKAAARVPPPRVAARQQRALSPEDLAARIAATGLVPTAYLLPWEPIHGPGDYATIAGAVRDLAQGDLPLTDVRDTIDLTGPEGTLEFSLDGVKHVVDLQVRDAELDEGVLVVLGALLERRQEKQPPGARRGLFVDPSTCRKAHTHLLVSATAEAMFAINAATGAAFVKATEL